MRILKALLPLAAVCSLAAQDTTPKVVLFNANALISKSVRGRQLFAELEVTGKNLQDRINAKREEGAKLQQQLESPSISDAGKEQLQKQMRDLEFEFKKLNEDSQQEFQKVQKKVYGQFQQEVGPIVEALAKERSVQMVLAYQEGLVLYGEEPWASSFTNEVAKRYDAKYASNAPAPAAEKPAAKPAPKGGKK